MDGISIINAMLVEDGYGDWGLVTRRGGTPFS